MDISAACLPPIQPVILPRHEQHPRFSEYRMYRASMSALLVTASSFDLWLRETEEREHSSEVVFNVNWRGVPLSDRPEDALDDGWYKHRFAPGHKLVSRHGPFATAQQAQAA